MEKGKKGTRPGEKGDLHLREDQDTHRADQKLWRKILIFALQNKKISTPTMGHQLLSCFRSPLRCIEGET